MADIRNYPARVMLAGFFVGASRKAEALQICRPTAAKVQPRTESGFAEKQVVPQPVAAPQEAKRSSAAKAAASKTNRGTVERNQMTDAYAPVREAAKERQQMSPGRPKKGQEKIPEVFDSIDQRAIKAGNP
ncbi:hypothetical protein [Thioalkalivibrio sulfidiphilus]|uniref:hypothetical protein n=1 Tax=Thioalkalivibrio sulfidiphilus TaxID=1033854 RepID=UPI003B29FB2F